jgi:L-amino acid N-acyltransferase YncA
MTTTLRLATPDDAAQVQRIYEPYCHTPISFEAVPPSVDEVRQRIIKVLARFPWLVLEHHGVICGYAYAGLHRERAAYAWSVDTSVYVAQDRQGQGIGRALYTSLFELLVLQGYINAYAGVTLPNPASVGLHQAMGFRPVGVYEKVGHKCGVWHDIGWFQRSLQPPPDVPQPPKTQGELCGSPAWQTALRAGLPFLRFAPNAG